MLKFDQIEKNSKTLEANQNCESSESPDVSGEASNRGNGNPKVIVEMTGKYMNPVNTQ